MSLLAFFDYVLNTRTRQINKTNILLNANREFSILSLYAAQILYCTIKLSSCEDMGEIRALPLDLMTKLGYSYLTKHCGWEAESRNTCVSVCKRW